MIILTQYIIAILAIILTAFIYFYVSFYRIRQFFKHIPSPPQVPIFGHALDFKTPGEFLKKIHEYARLCGGLYQLKIGLIRYTLVIGEEKWLEFLLSHNKLLRKSDNMRFLEPWIGQGLITADGGPKWKTHRKLLTPAFHFKILEQFVDVFEADGDILVKKLATESGKKSVDIYPYLTKCTLDAICETAMGTKVNVQNGQAPSYFQSVKEMANIFIVRSTSIILRYNFFYRFTKTHDIQEKSVKIMHDYTDKVIRNKRKELEERRQDQISDIDELGRRRKRAFLDLILEARVDNQSLTDEEIREEVDTFMFAGHDTTATASTFILYCVANNKDVQEKIIEEQEKIFGKEKNPKVTYTNLQEMKYLEAVIKEGLRLYSPVPFHGRYIDQDVDFNGLTIPKGVSVLVFPAAIHMNPKYYPEPEKFDPSRFETTDNKHPFAFLPFSAGPRNCIGQKFAMLELKSLVSKVVRNFELFPAYPKHELDLSPETVLKSLNGVKVGLKLRD